MAYTWNPRCTHLRTARRYAQGADGKAHVWDRRFNSADKELYQISAVLKNSELEICADRVPCKQVLSPRCLDMRDRQRGVWCLFLFNAAVLPSFPKASAYCQTFMWDRVTRGSFHSSLPGDIRHPPAVSPSLPACHPSSRWKTLHIFVFTPQSQPLNTSMRSSWRPFFKPYDAELILKITASKTGEANMEIVYTVPLASGYKIWQLDQMSGCVSKYKHMLEKVQKQDTVWMLFHIILKLCGFLK